MIKQHMPSHVHTQVHVRNGQRRWLHGTADCVTACAQPAPRSQRRITSTKTKRTQSRAWAKLRLGRASGYDVSLAQPQKFTSPTQLGTYGPGYLIVPWALAVAAAASAPATSPATSSALMRRHPSLAEARMWKMSRSTSAGANMSTAAQ